MATRLEWDERMLGLAEYVAQWSKDPSTKVGAVVADHEHRVLGVGYNGFPRSISDTDERLADRQEKYDLMVHAEVNALLNATRSVENCVIYTTFCPCSECTKLIIQSGIAKVVYRKASQELTDRWREKSRRSLGLLEEAGIPAEELP